MNINKINKLLSSSNRDDVILGTQFIHDYYKGDREKLYHYFKNHYSSAGELDIYIGEVNISYFGLYTHTIVYGKSINPILTKENVVYL